MDRSRVVLLVALALPIGCDARDRPSIGMETEAITSSPPAFNWSKFPDYQQCIVGVESYYNNAYGLGGAIAPPLCGLGNNGGCASCGACLVWVDNTPNASLFNRYAWGSKTPQAEDIVIFPPVYSAYGHAALVDHVDSSGVFYEMDDNWNDDTRKANCSYGDWVCGHVHTTGSYTPYGFYRLKSKDVTTTPYAGHWVGQSYPTDMTSGDVTPASLSYHNDGTATWDGNTRIGTTNPRDRSSVFADASWIGPGRPASVSASTPTGGTGNFDFVLKAPDVAADTSFTEDWGILQEGVTWFGPPDGSVWFKITVHPRYTASYQAASYPLIMVAGQVAPVSIDLKNTGTTTWDPSSTHLGTSDPNDSPSPFFDAATWLSAARPTAVAASTAPGAVGHFAFTLQAPVVTTATTYVAHWGLVDEGVAWMTLDQDVSFIVDVLPASSGTPQPTSLATPGGGPSSLMHGGCRTIPGSPSAVDLSLVLALAALAFAATRKRRIRG